MSARLENVSERIAQLPHGQVTQFIRQLESAGFTPNMLIYMLEKETDLYSWVQSAKALMDTELFGDSETFTLYKREYVPTLERYGVNYLQRVKDNVVRIRIDSGIGNVRIYSHIWVDVIPLFQVRLVEILDDERCVIAMRVRKEQTT